jgi:tetratricopeptide (TPR) repeat protein
MTFFELEKECKKRKRNKIFLIFLLFLIVISPVALKFFNFKGESKKIFKNKTVKNVKPLVKKIKKIENNKSVHDTLVLKPIIDLNITDYTETKKEKTVNKMSKLVKTIKKENNKTQNIILSFTNLPSFETSIKLAEKYYKNGDYQNALKWAKNANIQNKNNPKSWILVAKSLYKLGKKYKAIEVLEIYYKFTKNKNILQLIDRIKNGEI